MTEITQQSLVERCTDTTPRDRRNLRNMLLTLVVWALAFVAVGQGLKRGLVPPDGPLPWLAAALPTAIGIGVIAAYARYLREADELQRTIHYQALALGFGAGWLAACTSALLAKVDVPSVGIETIIWAMVAVYVIWVIFGQLRYR